MLYSNRLITVRNGQAGCKIGSYNATETFELFTQATRCFVSHSTWQAKDVDAELYADSSASHSIGETCVLSGMHSGMNLAGDLALCL